MVKLLNFRACFISLCSGSAKTRPITLKVWDGKKEYKVQWRMCEIYEFYQIRIRKRSETEREYREHLARLRTKLISSEIFKRSSTLLSHHVSFSKGSNEFKLKSAKKSSQFSIHWNFGVKISIIFITLRTHQWANEQKSEHSKSKHKSLKSENKRWKILK